jgi:hypothetical protein
MVEILFFKEHLRRINQYLEIEPIVALKPVCCKSLLYF